MFDQKRKAHEHDDLLARFDGRGFFGASKRATRLNEPRERGVGGHARGKIESLNSELGDCIPSIRRGGQSDLEVAGFCGTSKKKTRVRSVSTTLSGIKQNLRHNVSIKGNGSTKHGSAKRCCN